MKLDRESYKLAEGYLKRYNYNCFTITSIRNDTMSLQTPCTEGMPHTPYKVSDTVFEQVNRLIENKELQRACEEYKVVQKVLLLLSEEHYDVFELFYQKKKTCNEVEEKLGYSHETFKRRKKDLIYKVHELITPHH